MKLKLLFTLLAFLFLSLNAQVSLSTIKSSGIKSEEDLRSLGVSDAEIQSMKDEIFGVEVPQKIVKGEVGSNKPSKPVINELKISSPNTKIKVVDSSLVYGHSILQSGYFNLKENSDRIIPSPNYTLGTGDRISVTIWGSSEFNDEFTLDSYGNITPSKVGRISLKGKTFAQAQQILKYRFGRVYNLTSSKIAINLSYSKVISVNIVGEVVQPGTYNVPSVNSAFNILALAKGVKKTGSVRNIVIKRKGEIVTKIDLYEFLMAPTKFSSTFLQDGDFIVVNTQKGVVKAQGELKRPGYYETVEGENINEIIKFAGGFTAFANKETINLIGVTNNKLVFNSFSVSEIIKNNITINDGDVLNVLRISDLVYGKVEVKGAVNVPGEYKFSPGMKVSDLIMASKGTNRMSLLNHAQLIRTNKDMTESIFQINLNEVLESESSPSNLTLNELDVLNVFSKDVFINPSTVKGTGALKKEQEIPFYEGMVLNDLILDLGGFKVEADQNKIELERVLFHKSDSSDSYVKIVTLSYPEDADYKLSKFDIVNVRKLPEFEYQKSITIIGEVKYSGKYSLGGHNDRLSELIERAGGLTEHAFLKGAKLERKADSLGLLLMNLEHALKKSNSYFNYILKPGDIITIPKNLNIVSISGAIGYKNTNSKENIINSPYHKSRRAGFYVKKYGGGYDDKARKKSLYVIGSNGMVKESLWGGMIKPYIEPGDKIVVEYKDPKPEKTKKDPVDWNRIIENSTIKLTGLLTILVLANSAFGN